MASDIKATKEIRKYNTQKSAAMQISRHKIETFVTDINKGTR